MIIDNAFEAAGYALLEQTNPRCLGEFPTWEKDGVRIALYRESLKAHGGNVLRQPADGDEITLHGIIVDLAIRLKGKANATMDLLLNEADRHSITIYIEPVPMVRGGMNRSQLVAFYAKHGFVGTDSTNTVMLRRPGAAPAQRSMTAAAVAVPPAAISSRRVANRPRAVDRPMGSLPALAGVFATFLPKLIGTAIARIVRNVCDCFKPGRLSQKT